MSYYRDDTGRLVKRVEPGVTLPVTIACTAKPPTERTIDYRRLGAVVQSEPSTTTATAKRKNRPSLKARRRYNKRMATRGDKEGGPSQPEEEIAPFSKELYDKELNAWPLRVAIAWSKQFKARVTDSEAEELTKEEEECFSTLVDYIIQQTEELEAKVAVITLDTGDSSPNTSEAGESELERKQSKAMADFRKYSNRVGNRRRRSNANRQGQYQGQGFDWLVGERQMNVGWRDIVQPAGWGSNVFERTSGNVAARRQFDQNPRNFSSYLGEPTKVKSIVTVAKSVDRPHKKDRRHEKDDDETDGDDDDTVQQGGDNSRHRRKSSPSTRRRRVDPKFVSAIQGTTGLYAPPACFRTFASHVEKQVRLLDVDRRDWTKVLALLLGEEANAYLMPDQLDEICSLSWHEAVSELASELDGKNDASYRAEAETFKQGDLGVLEYIAQKRHKIHRADPFEREENVCRQVLAGMNEVLRRRIENHSPAYNWRIKELQDVATRFEIQSE